MVPEQRRHSRKIGVFRAWLLDEIKRMPAIAAMT
jgi:hypothetical protein